MPELKQLTLRDQQNLMTFFDESSLNDLQNKPNLEFFRTLKKDMSNSLIMQENGTCVSLEIAKLELNDSLNDLRDSVDKVSQNPQLVELLTFINAKTNSLNGENFHDLLAKNNNPPELAEALSELKHIQFNGSLKDEFLQIQESYNNYKTELMLYNIIHGNLIINSNFDENKKLEFNNQRENVIKDSLKDSLTLIDAVSPISKTNEKTSLAVELNQFVNEKIIGHKFDGSYGNNMNRDSEPSKTTSATYSP